MGTRTLLYDMGAIVRDDLAAHAADLAAAVDRDEVAVEYALQGARSRYLKGEISQSRYWEDAAARLDLVELDDFVAYAIHTAEFESELLGWIRGQQADRLGLVSDATPDFVGHFRRELKLDRLFRVHVINSESDDYAKLLRTAAERLQAKPNQVWFVDRKPQHLAAARELGMGTVDLARVTDLAAAFRTG